jgi:hypothetical protein
MSLFSPKPPKLALLPPYPRRRCDLVVIFAVAENEWLGVEDLLDSLSTYLDCDYEVLAIDDATTDGTYDRLRNAGIWVMRNPENLYLWGLDLTLRRGFHTAVELFDSPLYLKIDPDALLIGPRLLQAAHAVFAQKPHTGLLGTYQINWNGETRDLSYWRERMLVRQKDLGTPFKLAQSNGYQIGDGVQGGAYLLSGECLTNIKAKGWLGTDTDYQPAIIRGQHVAEDSLIAMLTYAAGFQAAEFGGPNQPFGLWDIGLPMPPEELVTQGRIITHAMKYKDEASLAARNFFRERRAEFRLTTGKP